MNPVLFPMVFSMSRALAEDVGAPELGSTFAFALHPRRRASRFTRLCQRLFSAREPVKASFTPAKNSEQACSTQVGGSL